jgi:hypothetical protein
MRAGKTQLMDILAAINHLSSSKSPPHKQHLPCPINQNLWDNLQSPDGALKILHVARVLFDKLAAALFIPAMSVLQPLL